MQESMYAIAQDQEADKRERVAAALAYERLEARRAVVRNRPGSITYRLQPEELKLRRKKPAPTLPMLDASDLPATGTAG